jgi:hypothetical protein
VTMHHGPQPASPLGGDSWQEAATRQYRAVRNATLKRFLMNARAGLLDARWRESLEVPTRKFGAHQMYTDADRLAVDEVRELPPARGARKLVRLPWRSGFRQHHGRQSPGPTNSSGTAEHGDQQGPQTRVDRPRGGS